jgi:hypothetical protein
MSEPFFELSNLFVDGKAEELIWWCASGGRGDEF